MSDIDWTIITGGNPHHVAAFAIGINASFEDLLVTQDDIRIDSRQGKIDNQIILEVLKEKGVSDEDAMRALPEIVRVATEYFLDAYENETTISDHVLSGAKSLFGLLKKYRIPVCVLSGNIEKIAWARLKKMGLAEFVIDLAGGNMALHRGGLYPVLEARLEQKLGYKVSKDQLVVLDDAALGVQSAHEYGITAIIGVETGKSTKAELLAAGATFTVQNIISRDHQIVAFLE